jgi:hypothetical protein
MVDLEALGEYTLNSQLFTINFNKKVQDDENGWFKEGA